MDNTSKKGGRLTAVERDYKKSQGKDLFIKGFTLTNISEIIGVGVKTLSGWRDTDEWEKEKELNNIRPSEIKRMILEYVRDLKNGDTEIYVNDLTGFNIENLKGGINSVPREFSGKNLSCSMFCTVFPDPS